MGDQHDGDDRGDQQVADKGIAVVLLPHVKIGSQALSYLLIKSCGELYGEVISVCKNSLYINI